MATPSHTVYRPLHQLRWWLSMATLFLWTVTTRAQSQMSPLLEDGLRPKIPILNLNLTPDYTAIRDEPSYIANASELSGIIGDRQQMEEYIAVNPDSYYTPWLHNSLASTYRHTGRITLALSHWRTVWRQCKDSTDKNLQSEADHALAGQLELLTMLGRVNELHDLLEIARGRGFSDPADRERYQKAREGYAIMVRNPELNFRCGTLALAEIARMQGKPISTINALIEEPSPKEGISLLRLVQLSRQYGLGLVPVKRTDNAPLPTPCVVHWAQNHYGALLDYRSDLGGYRVIFGDPNWMSAPDVDAESSGYFLIPESKRPASWPIVSDAECAHVLGRSFIYSINDKKDYGCKAQPTAPKAKCPTCPKGMPGWWVTEPYINVFLADEPVDYTTSRGEDFSFQVTIKQRDSLGTVFTYPRPGVLHNWYSRIFFQGMPTSIAQYTTNAISHQVTTNYVAVPETNAFASWTATADLPTGGQVTYNSSSNGSPSYDEDTGTTLAPAYGKLNDGTQYPIPGFPIGGNNTAPTWNYSALPGTSTEDGFQYPGFQFWNDGAAGFRIFHEDGSVDTYGLMCWATNTALGIYEAEAILTQHTDPIGDNVTLLYQTYTNLAGTVYIRLTQVMDYDGYTNNFVYYSNTNNLLKQIITPYNQTATFAYDNDGNLTNITDAVTNSSGITWNTNGWVTALNTPYGTTTFNYYDADLPGTNFSNINGDIPVDRSVTVVDPNGGTNIYAYCFYTDNSSEIEPYEFSSTVIPQGTPLGTFDVGTNEVANHDYAAACFRNSFYWDTRVVPALSTMNVASMTASDFEKARMQHWLGDVNNVSQTDLLSVEQDSSPDGTTPGQLTFYDYYGKTLPWLQGTNSQVAVTATVLPSGQTQYDWKQYNSAHYVTKDVSTYTAVNGSVQTRTNSFIYANNTISYSISNAIAGYPFVSPQPYYLNYGSYTESYDNGDGLYDVPTPVAPLFDATESSSNTCGAWTPFIAGTSSYSCPCLLAASVDPSGATNQYGGYTTVATTALAQEYVAWYNPSEPYWDEAGTEEYYWPQYVIKTYTVPLPSKITNALGYIATRVYNGNNKITSMTSPAGLTTTYAYNGAGFLTNVTDVQIGRTNAYSYANGMIHTWQNELGLSTTYTWDKLNRLTSQSDQQGYITNIYNRLDLVSTRDKVGNWTSYGYDPLERLLATTNANNGVTTFGWCDCGALTSVMDALTNVTTFDYDYQSRLTSVYYPDNSSLLYQFDLNGNITNVIDGAGRVLKYSYNNQGLLTAVNNNYSQAVSTIYDIVDRPLQVTDANGVTSSNTFDAAGDLLRRTWQDGKSDSFGYSAFGLIAYTNRDGKFAHYGRDAAGRLIAVTNANNEIIRLTYNASSEIVSLVDGANHTNFWQYNQSGWLTNKIDGLGRNVLQLSYNANGWVTNRWTKEKGNTAYSYDGVGNVLLVSYPSSSVQYFYDADNRLTNMVDAVGATSFSYTPAGQLASETGPWANDEVSATYSQGLRTGLTINEPVGYWSQGYNYDAAWRMTNISFSAGQASYLYTSPSSTLLSSISLPNGAAITNVYDSLGRLTQTALNNHWGHNLDGYSYSLDSLGLKTNIVRNLGITSSTVAAGYDNIGQLTSWLAKETNGVIRQNEQLSFGFDSADNLHSRNNGSLSQTFTVDGANELTNVSRSGPLTFSGALPAPATNITVNGTPAQLYGDFTFAATNNTLANGLNTFTIAAENVYGVTTNNTLALNLPQSVNLAFDNNGNLTNDGTRTFYYNTENQLTNVFVPNAWRYDFVYDGLGRLRIMRNYTWTGAWTQTNEIHYVYDGHMPVQERDINNNVLVTFTRGLDLSGSIQGAGGVGSLLARTDSNGSTFYHHDGNGNITALIDSQEDIVARYLYGPFGKISGQWGQMASANDMQFSSMLQIGGLAFYPFRIYEPNFQRFLNEDPIQEIGGINLYRAMNNDPLLAVDPYGLFVASPEQETEAEEAFATTEEVEGDSGPVGWVLGVGTAAAAFVGADAYELNQINQLQNQNQQAQAHIQQLEQQLQNQAKNNAPKCDQKKRPPQTYYHYSRSPPSSFAGGLWPQSAATTIPGLNAQTASQGLGIPPPIYQYPVTIDPTVTPVTPPTPVDASARYSGGLPQVFFPAGTPPGSVGPPTIVPQ
jgi:RHS repeat-associated protein